MLTASRVPPSSLIRPPYVTRHPHIRPAAPARRATSLAFSHAVPRGGAVSPTRLRYIATTTFTSKPCCRTLWLLHGDAAAHSHIGAAAVYAPPSALCRIHSHAHWPRSTQPHSCPCIRYYVLPHLWLSPALSLPCHACSSPTCTASAAGRAPVEMLTHLISCPIPLAAARPRAGAACTAGTLGPQRPDSTPAEALTPSTSCPIPLAAAHPGVSAVAPGQFGGTGRSRVGIGAAAKWGAGYGSGGGRTGGAGGPGNRRGGQRTRDTARVTHVAARDGTWQGWRRRCGEGSARRRGGSGGDAASASAAAQGAGGPKGSGGRAGESKWEGRRQGRR